MLPVISLYGILASGKSALGSRLSKQFNLYHLFVPELLTSLSNSPFSGTKTVKRYIYDYIMEGGIIPADLCDYVKKRGFMDQTVEVVLAYCHQHGLPTPLAILLPFLQKKMERVAKEGNYRAILLDGFPRIVDDLKASRKVFGKDILDLAIVVDCPYEVALARYEKRCDDAIGKNIADFSSQMPELYPELERIGLVRILSDDSVSIHDAYIGLLANLYPNRTWNKIINS
ncbi:uncharacterized protein F4807DRAFT_424307 [Annulohypoxylon truncatum]|uniref:uncharacterized protein n=1 Tax=Annulohypoxylon truncatum TaxID=327061 RepID=UPI0020076A07|nr:uncharacterized protein F4807DRAFT_424307 [Annulohypoxylon truncatum]KAI1210220.1 hypothetical protein F4807DRAFT_424307 [Annulohypoxylon truncatum]